MPNIRFTSKINIQNPSGEPEEGRKALIGLECLILMEG
jgi:hypothetical protein